MSKGMEKDRSVYDKWDKRNNRSDSAYERWERRSRKRQDGNRNRNRPGVFDIFFDVGEKGQEESFLKDLKGRVQNNLEGLFRVLTTAVIVLLQFLVIIFLPFLLRSSTVYFYFVLELCSVVAIVSLVNKNQSANMRMAWISIVLLLPISGFLFYYLWGREGGKKKKLDAQIREQIAYGRQFLEQDKEVYEKFINAQPVSGRMVKYMVNEGIPLRKENAVKFYPSGEKAFEDIFRAMENAKEFILIDFFIVADGALFDKMHEILKRKVEQGVEVKFLYDDFGGAIRTQRFFRQILEHEGVEVRIFNPIHKYTGQLYMNYRSHQKIVVVDGKVGFTGGFNLADEYANLVERFGVWKDTGICVAGEAVWDLTVIFLQMWEACKKVTEHIDYLKYKKKASVGGDTYCQVLSDGPAFNPKNTIESVYNQMITFADKFLYITTPYLIIEDFMRQSLIEAARRGVDVRIVTPGIPDKKYTKILTNYNYGNLLKEGVHIYEYTPGFIHAKQILSENAVIVGTINMDYRSFYLHYENGVWMSGAKIKKQVKKDFNQIFEVSKEITYEEWLNRPGRYKLIQPVLNLFSTLF
ncbi:MAG: cardiolipin synthase [Lachnospiraceae bacterium]|nr:cardiolipin synthase [Lachnospiraceae bacterium]